MELKTLKFSAIEPGSYSALTAHVITLPYETAAFHPHLRTIVITTTEADDLAKHITGFIEREKLDDIVGTVESINPADFAAVLADSTTSNETTKDALNIAIKKYESIQQQYDYYRESVKKNSEDNTEDIQTLKQKLENVRNMYIRSVTAETKLKKKIQAVACLLSDLEG